MSPQEEKALRRLLDQAIGRALVDYEFAHELMTDPAKALEVPALGFAWTDATATQVYTVFDLFPFLADEIVRRGAARGGLTWHFCRPPVVGLDYEMDCRGVRIERLA